MLQRVCDICGCAVKEEKNNKLILPTVDVKEILTYDGIGIKEFKEINIHEMDVCCTCVNELANYIKGLQNKKINK